MFRKIIAVLLVVLILFCLSTPAFAVGEEIILTEAMKQGLFWSMSRAIGIQGQGINLDFGDTTTMLDIKLHDPYNQFIQLNQLYFDTLWNHIKNCVTEIGTITTETGKVLPNYKIEVNSSNSDYIRSAGAKIRDFWKNKVNLQSNDSITMFEDYYGGYLRYAEGFIGKAIYYTYNNRNWSHLYFDSSESTSLNTFFTLGMYIYQLYHGTSYERVLFDSSSNSIQFKDENLWTSGDPDIPFWNPANHFGNIDNNGGVTFVLDFAYPVHLSASASIHFDISQVVQETNSPDPQVRWDKLYLIPKAAYDSNPDINYANNSVLTSDYTSPDISNITGNVQPGDYYVLARLRITHSSAMYITFNKNIPIINDFIFEIDSSSAWNKEKLSGVRPVTQWSYNVTDSGTGSGSNILVGSGTIASPFPKVFEDEDDVPGVLYFPGLSITDGNTGAPDLTVNEFNEIMASDYVATGTLSVDPNNSSGNSEPPVNVDLTLPSSLGLSSIWHYVEDTITYCSHYISVMFGTIIPALPTPLLNLAWASVVLGIIFGLYRRFIE